MVKDLDKSRPQAGGYEKGEHTQSKQPKKTKQQLACEYIRENYLDFGSLRYDLIADKLQVREAHSLEDASLQNAPERLQLRGSEYWRYLTNCDINTIVCDAAQYYDVNISNKEVLIALHSHLIPRVHPLREYIHSLPPYKPESGDWIDMLARQVVLKYPDSSTEEERQCLDERWRVCFKKWFVAMVASWMNDDVVL